MNMALIQTFLLWCTIINYALLLLWFVFFTRARDWMYQLHTRWFNISQQNFDTLHYACMALFKIGIFLFNFVPLLVISFIL